MENHINSSPQFLAGQLHYRTCHSDLPHTGDEGVCHGTGQPAGNRQEWLLRLFRGTTEGWLQRGFLLWFWLVICSSWNNLFPFVLSFFVIIFIIITLSIFLCMSSINKTLVGIIKINLFINIILHVCPHRFLIFIKLYTVVGTLSFSCMYIPLLLATTTISLSTTDA